MAELKSGTYITRLRSATGLTQKAFAEKIGCNRTYISQLENNVVDISLSTFVYWIELFEIEDIKSIIIEETS